MPERRVARGSIRIVLHPVTHANNRRHAVNHQHVRTDLHRFAGKTHRGKQRLVDTEQHQTYAQNRAAAQEHKAFCALVGCVQLAGAHACADQNGSRFGETGKEADDHALQRAEHRDGRNGLFGLSAQNNVDNHVAHADEHFVADDGEALDEVDFHLLLIPAEMLLKWNRYGYFCARAKIKMTKTLITAAKDVASAAPRTPISGKPNFP